MILFVDSEDLGLCCLYISEDTFSHGAAHKKFTTLWEYSAEYSEKFTTKTEKKNQIKTPGIFHISTQNIDYGYSLEPSR